MDFIIRIALILLSLGSVTARADIVSCARAAASNSIECRRSSTQARIQANQLSSSYSQMVSGKSAKQTADMMADVTSRISAIYQAAEDQCNNAIESCQEACSGSANENRLANACKAEMGRDLAQLGAGHGETFHGTLGGQASSFQAKADMSSGGAGDFAAAGNPNVSGGGAPTPSGEAINPTFNGGKSGNATNPAFAGGKPGELGEAISFDSAGEATNPRFNHSGSGLSPGTRPGLTGTGGATNPAFNHQADGSSGANATTRGPSQPASSASGRGRSGSSSDSGWARSASIILPQMVAKYCSDSRNNKCPSCSGSNAGNMSRGQSSVLYGACTAECMADPVYGRQMIEGCQNAARAKAMAGNSGRSPAAVKPGFGSAHGPSLFIIHSRVIYNMCENFRLKCWPLSKLSDTRRER